MKSINATVSFPTVPVFDDDALAGDSDGVPNFAFMSSTNFIHFSTWTGLEEKRCTTFDGYASIGFLQVWTTRRSRRPGGSGTGGNPDDATDLEVNFPIDGSDWVP